MTSTALLIDVKSSSNDGQRISYSEAKSRLCCFIEVDFCPSVCGSLTDLTGGAQRPVRHVELGRGSPQRMKSMGADLWEGRQASIVTTTSDALW
ncbi:hypothetical protein MUK42_34432 [Musa troglodytarum]|uniref:Uncharacterized protein n=1 Tax=Musa troglodytarum TaxID=320322 RepID=A0A9E7EHM4_9LILI|nr:hypothetical protein MUK42_34432 [Musa troglodytarum]